MTGDDSRIGGPFDRPSCPWRHICHETLYELRYRDRRLASYRNSACADLPTQVVLPVGRHVSRRSAVKLVACHPVALSVSVDILATDAAVSIVPIEAAYTVGREAH